MIYQAYNVAPLTETPLTDEAFSPFKNLHVVRRTSHIVSIHLSKIREELGKEPIHLEGRVYNPFTLTGPIQLNQCPVSGNPIAGKQDIYFYVGLWTTKEGKVLHFYRLGVDAEEAPYFVDLICWDYYEEKKLALVPDIRWGIRADKLSGNNLMECLELVKDTLEEAGCHLPGNTVNTFPTEAAHLQFRQEMRAKFIGLR